MVMHTFLRSSYFPVSCEELFQWHERIGAFDRMVPPWMHLDMISRNGTIHNGDEVSLRMHFGPFSLDFKFLHQNYIANSQFQDVQIKGPFSYYAHTHRFEAVEDNKSKITDIIQYKLPLASLSHFATKHFIEDRLNRLFTYRHRTLKCDLFLHSKYSQKKLKILITGASGLVGSALAPFLTTGGHTVIKLVRSHHKSAQQPKQENVAYWDSEQKCFLNPEILQGLDAVVHLAGENIAAHKWSNERKQQLIDSRVHFTSALCNALTQLKTPPKTFIAASGVGIFGDRDYDDILHEDSKPGEGFLAKLALDWENAADGARNAGIRVVHLRFGTIVSLAGGVLKKMYTPYRMCLGGPFGSGRQMMSWIAITDVLGLILFAITNPNIDGAVNAVSPHALSNEQFSQMLAQAMGRPSSLRIPELVVETLFGEMGRELLLSGQHAKPIKATKHGYEFLHGHLHDALTYCLGV